MSPDNMTHSSQLPRNCGQTSSSDYISEQEEDQQKQTDVPLQPPFVLPTSCISGNGGQAIVRPISDEKRSEPPALRDHNVDGCDTLDHRSTINGLSFMLAPPPSYSSSPLSEEEAHAVLYAPPLPPPPPPSYYAPYFARMQPPYLTFSQADTSVNQQIWDLEQQTQEAHKKHGPKVISKRRYRTCLTSWRDVCYEGLIIVVVTVVTPHRLH
ncbi:hypothetical protein BCR43DRAFT_511605 [Syncephalastrum racemosum]|uniref:Uncharacterized protein n=1 Tax=Syncephalastrum racemosum TaxID=13706 RepID=A0A1X2HMQ4_SYNRA|nr:hypothetical protein BCR43DRAFT_511605 [Syncephalastrum racemosum]